MSWECKTQCCKCATWLIVERGDVFYTRRGGGRYYFECFLCGWENEIPLEVLSLRLKIEIRTGSPRRKEKSNPK